MRTLLALLGVCALAWLALSLLARRGIGTGARAAGNGARIAGLFGARTEPARLQVLERLALSPRRQLYLVRADGRTLLLGSSEGGALTLIAELAGDTPQVSPTVLAAALHEAREV